MPAWLAPAIIGGVSLIGSLLQSKSSGDAATDAADAQLKAAQLGIEEQRRQFDTMQQILMPYAQAGNVAINEQMALLGIGGPQETSFKDWYSQTYGGPETTQYGDYWKFYGGPVDWGRELQWEETKNLPINIPEEGTWNPIIAQPPPPTTTEPPPDTTTGTPITTGDLTGSPITLSGTKSPIILSDTGTTGGTVGTQTVRMPKIDVTIPDGYYDAANDRYWDAGTSSWIPGDQYTGEKTPGTSIPTDAKQISPDQMENIKLWDEYLDTQRVSTVTNPYAGMSGAEAQAAAIGRIAESPLLQELTRQGEQAILQQSAATGGLRGGNIQAALAQYRPQMLQNEIDKQYSRLQNMGLMGQASAAGSAAAAQQTGTNVSNLLGQAGAAQAGGILGRGQATSDLYGGLSQAGLYGLGMYGQSQGWFD